MHVDEAVVDRTAEEGARLVALALLSDCDAAADRLAAGDEAEALHDFRVGLRRLRTVLRAFRPWLEGSVRKRSEKKLKALAGATNDARDAEVQLAFLADQRKALGARQRAGLDFLEERFQTRRREGTPPAERVVERYRRASRKLASRLQRYEGRLTADAKSVTFGGALAGLLEEQLDGMRGRLAAVEGPADELQIHKARIAAKRLRYLLEPLRGNRHADAREVVKHLKALQDVLGELHDAHVLAREIAAALVEAAAERARRLHALYEADAGAARARQELRGSPRPGVLAMVRLVRERRDALFAELEREWRTGGGLEALAGEVHAVVAALEARSGGHLETERRYLLSGVPPRAEGEAAQEMDLGWLPGDVVRERVGHIRGTGRERYWRSLDQGAGPQRLEAHEETRREVFEALWALTAGRRLAIRRRAVEEGGVAWLVDELVGRDVVLARAQLPPVAVDVAIPDWLRPYVVREVTDDPAYRDDALAAGDLVSAAPEHRAALPQPQVGDGASSAVREPTGAGGA